MAIPRILNDTWILNFGKEPFNSEKYLEKQKKLERAQFYACGYGWRPEPYRCTNEDCDLHDD